MKEINFWTEKEPAPVAAGTDSEKKIFFDNDYTTLEKTCQAIAWDQLVRDSERLRIIRELLVSGRSYASYDVMAVAGVMPEDDGEAVTGSDRV